MRWLLILLLGVVGSCAHVDSTAPTYDYDRRDWRHWVDEDGDCQDTRQEVLIASSSTEVVYADSRGCRVQSGTWVDPYTGVTYTDPSELDIDHLVALKEAHDSGGSYWPDSRKQAFANDFGNLIAVSASANRSKSNRDPLNWLPPNPESRCGFIAHWVEVKQAWALAMPQCKEIQALLDRCAAGELPDLPQATN
jgi:hypothetical protein